MRLKIKKPSLESLASFFSTFVIMTSYFILFDQFDFWYDELGSLSFSTYPLGDLLLKFPDRHHPPLFYLFLKGWYKIGELFFIVPPPWFLKAISFFPGAALLLIIQRKIFIEDGTLPYFKSFPFLVFSPVFIFFMQELRSYTWLCFFFFLWLFEFNKNGKQSFKTILYLTLGILTHYLMAAYALLYVVSYSLAKKKFGKIDKIQIGIAPLVLFGLFKVFDFQSFSFNFKGINFLGEFIIGLFESLISVDKNLNNYFLLGLFVPYLLIHFCFFFRKKDYISLYPLVILFFFSFSLFLKDKSYPVTPPRYLLPASLFLGYSLSKLRFSTIRGEIFSVGLYSILALHVFFHPEDGLLNSSIRPPYRKAFETIKQNGEFETLYICPKYFTSFKNPYFYYPKLFNLNSKIEILNCPSAIEFMPTKNSVALIDHKTGLWEKVENAKVIFESGKVKVVKFE